MDKNLSDEEIRYIKRKIRKGIVWSCISATSALIILLATRWHGIASTGFILFAGVLSLFSLVMVLKLNAEALHRQTKEDIAFIHLSTSLLAGLALLCPIIGAWFSLKTASMALQGKCMRSGGTLKASPPPHAIGRTSYHLGILLLILTVVVQGGWVIFLHHVYSAFN